jgi:hypothetical protein
MISFLTFSLTTLDTDLLAYVLGLFRLACHVETVAAGDRDHPAAWNNQIGAALVALSVARLILLILLHPLCGKQIDAAARFFRCVRTGEFEAHYVDDGFAVGASSFNRQGSPRSFNCATA